MTTEDSDLLDKTVFSEVVCSIAFFVDFSQLSKQEINNSSLLGCDFVIIITDNKR
jgi:hypothetical protein